MSNILCGWARHEAIGNLLIGLSFFGIITIPFGFYIVGAASLIRFRPPRVRHMFRQAPRRYRHDVESKAQIAPFRMLGQEGRRRSFDPPLLARSHRFERPGERAVAPRRDTPAHAAQQQRTAPLGRVAAQISAPPLAHFFSLLIFPLLIRTASV